MPCPATCGSGSSMPTTHPGDRRRRRWRRRTAPSGRCASRARAWRRAWRPGRPRRRRRGPRSRRGGHRAARWPRRDGRRRRSRRPRRPRGSARCEVRTPAARSRARAMRSRSASRPLRHPGLLSGTAREDAAHGPSLSSGLSPSAPEFHRIGPLRGGGSRTVTAGWDFHPTPRGGVPAMVLVGGRSSTDRDENDRSTAQRGVRTVSSRPISARTTRPSSTSIPRGER